MTTITATGTIFLNYDGNVNYSLNGGTTYTPITSWPTTVINNTPDMSTLLIVYFVTNITLSSYAEYFIIGSDYITWNGQSNTITIDYVQNYRGVFSNYATPIYIHTIIENIGVLVASSDTQTTLAQSSGWVCQYNSYAVVTLSLIHI